MISEIVEVLFTFSVFSILGWILEVSYRSYNAGRFVNPGLLKGPYLILYGTSALILIVAISLLRESGPAIKALVYIIIITGLEFASGVIAKRLFNTRLWDYSDQHLNYKGYICLKFSIYWTFAAFVFEYLIFPAYKNALFGFPPSSVIFFAIALSSIMLVDFLTLSVETFFRLTPEEREILNRQYTSVTRPLLEDQRVAILSECNHHNGKSRLDHVKEVAYLGLIAGKKLSLDCDAIVRGALLHDLFYYDWLREGPRLHGFRHPNISLKNAREITSLSRKEEDIIKKHMWPLTVIPPIYLESLVVSSLDTFCSIRDYLTVKRYYETAKTSVIRFGLELIERGR
ncbi:MAG: phosphohydrolase [Deltaproteobacteria bacterium]|uniref:Phosphohydrolase n=1 Tax=Candidatus Zymogenus saltonus TaxID=2844893 RepID=A0A9D8KGS9_9DELT|nr:phosphohydrolase [Candidatus Zymogenus saltonus]